MLWFIFLWFSIYSSIIFHTFSFFQYFYQNIYLFSKFFYFSILSDINIQKFQIFQYFLLFNSIRFQLQEISHFSKFSTFQFFPLSTSRNFPFFNIFYFSILSDINFQIFQIFNIFYISKYHLFLIPLYYYHSNSNQSRQFLSLNHYITTF